ncbi:UDP-N-acetylmuramoyl-L-alanyl-D-glutamate--2,6-diaminopimelate ligase [Clostridium saccharobutylicum]|uniref:UDP-N-acetylmuramoyl-L-alanyl-D-glutamate--2,6-diaminopimelate ligase n=1 Tax=Clostridium saccharobutylicum TaxID=169679 RepID=A0A1S8MT50_CLOSA|nr:UDP-N-acetylmuramoyl-L-alanyl-D-glutamate--2,6-diaminopimelate ligase [Clostridium saccharobutylicum]OOM07353.1 UDP-N-acetylmuramoyl-L-alanyl-D-glutamate--LD-lysine ligase [Clostridium saccharobutylicum]
MKLYDLLYNIDYMIVNGQLDKEIESISYDSRKIMKNSLFVCIKGNHVDGHDFIKEGIKKGALAIVVDEEIQIKNSEITVIKVENTKIALASIANTFYKSPSKEIELIGVTGTNGKTTVIHYIKDVLEGYGRKTGIIGTLGYELKGEDINIDKTNPTTPESLELQQVFRKFINKGAKDIVMEVTSSALAQYRVDNCDFNVGVFTNFSQDHLEEHGTLEAYKNEKIKLFKRCKVGIINLDEKISQEIIRKSNCEILTYGIKKDADIRATQIRYDSNKVTFNIKFKNLRETVKIDTPGKFTVYNALAAIGACYALGIDIKEIFRLISNVKHVPGRVEILKNSLNKNIIIDYAHTPDALEKLLMMAKDIAKGRIITVFGCGGERDKTKRPIMGMIGGIMSDYCIVTSDNPRREDPESIIWDIEEGMKIINCHYEKVVDRKEAIVKAINMLKDEDLLIIAGKGHEDYQVIGDKKLHFDDREVVRQFI